MKCRGTFFLFFLFFLFQLSAQSKLQNRGFNANQNLDAILNLSTQSISNLYPFSQKKEREGKDNEIKRKNSNVNNQAIPLPVSNASQGNYPLPIPQPTHLKGKINNPTFQSIAIKFYKDLISFEETEFVLPLGANNEFDFQFDLSEPTVAKLVYGNVETEIFIEPGNTLEISSSGSSFIWSLKFEGDGAANNEFLKDFNNEFINENESKIYGEIVSKRAMDFRYFLDGIHRSKWNFYHTYDYKKRNKFTSEFRKYIIGEIDYWWAYSLLRYHWEHPASNGLPHPMKISPSYYNFLGKILVSNDFATKSRNYLNFLVLYLKLREDNPDIYILNEIDQSVFEAKTTELDVVISPSNRTVLRKLFKGERIKYLNSKTSTYSSLLVNGTYVSAPWYKVRTLDGREGWVFGGNGKIIGGKEPEKQYKKIKLEEEYTRLVAISKVGKLRVRETPGTAAAIALLNEGELMNYLGNKSSQKYTFTIRGETVTDYFYNIETSTRKIGWVFGGGIEMQEVKGKRLIDKTIVVETKDNVRDNSELYLTGRALFYTMANKVFWKCKDIHTDPSKVEKEVNDFVARCPYPEFDEAINKAYSNALKREYGNKNNIAQAETKNTVPKIVEKPTEPISNSSLDEGPKNKKDKPKKTKEKKQKPKKKKSDALKTEDNIVGTVGEGIPSYSAPEKTRIQDKAEDTIPKKTKNKKRKKNKKVPEEEIENIADNIERQNIAEDPFVVSTSKESKTEETNFSDTLPKPVPAPEKSKPLSNKATTKNVVTSGKLDADLTAELDLIALGYTRVEAQKIIETRRREAAQRAEATPPKATQTAGSRIISPAKLMSQIDLSPDKRVPYSVKLTGKIRYHKNKNAQIILYTDPVSMQEVNFNLYVKPDGAFSTVLKIYEPTIGKFIYGARHVDIYLEPGNDMEITFLANDFKKTLKFEGEGNIHNEFLQSLKSEFKNEDIESKGKIYSSTASEFKRFVKEIHERKIKFYNKSKAAFSDNFDQYIKHDIDYWYAYNLTNYRWENPLQYGNSKPLTIKNSNYYDYINEIGVVNEGAIPSQFYSYFLDLYLKDKAQEQENRGLTDIEIASKYLHGKPMYYFQAKRLAAASRNGKLSEVLFDVKRLMDECPYESYKESMKSALRESNTLLTGMDAPSFTLLDEKGRKVTLSNFKGKVIYLDFWATWCTACTRQMSNSDNLRNTFKDKDVVFIYVSVDNSSYEWKNYLRTHKLPGKHIYAEGALKSDMAKDYGVKKLPALFIIDKEGKIARNIEKIPNQMSVIDQINYLLVSP